MKFIKAAYQKKMVKVEIESGNPVWATCSDAVHAFAKKAFKEGDEVDIQYDQKNGQYFVTRITKPGQSTYTNKEEYSPKTDFPKTTPTNIVNSNSTAKKYTSYSKSPEDKEQIKRLSVLRAVSTAVQTMTGQLDANTLGDYIEELYRKLYKVVSE